MFLKRIHELCTSDDSNFSGVCRQRRPGLISDVMLKKKENQRTKFAETLN